MTENAPKPDAQTLRDFFGAIKSVAVVGAKDVPGQPVDRVGRYLIETGYEVMPVHPARASVWGLPAAKTLGGLPKTPDAVVLFRAAEYCPGHARECLQLNPLPKLFWMQLGIKSEEAAALMREAGVYVVEDACIMVDHKEVMSQLPNG